MRGRALKRGCIPLQSLWKCQRGATAIEYGLILVLITVAVIGSISGVANKTINMWGNVSNEVKAH
jgi:pilus assembly protein Flp/PilA